MKIKFFLLHFFAKVFLFSNDLKKTFLKKESDIFFQYICEIDFFKVFFHELY
jgi:hypothetical protein